MVNHTLPIAEEARIVAADEVVAGIGVGLAEEGQGRTVVAVQLFDIST